MPRSKLIQIAEAHGKAALVEVLLWREVHAQQRAHGHPRTNLELALEDAKALVAAQKCKTRQAGGPALCRTWELKEARALFTQWELAAAPLSVQTAAENAALELDAANHAFACANVAKTRAAKKQAQAEEADARAAAALAHGYDTFQSGRLRKVVRRRYGEWALGKDLHFVVVGQPEGLMDE